ncbi:hypothetical protein KAX08_01515 [candidate division WOR-3 bacterium]|nr:hypothetical protein [candidate division WOR-3 bacterium]
MNCGSVESPSDIIRYYMCGRFKMNSMAKILQQSSNRGYLEKDLTLIKSTEDEMNREGM